MTLTGNGCSVSTGVTFEGQVVADNAVTWRDFDGEPTYDPGQPMQIDFQAFGIVDGGVRRAFDGVLDQSSPEASRYSAHAVLVAELPLATVSQDLATDCATVGGILVCEITSGTATIEGLGRFSIEGTVGTGDGRYHGSLTLLGQQTLHLDLDTIDRGCHPYTIDGELAGVACISAPGPGLELELGYGGGCLDGELRVEGYVDQVVDTMTLEVLGPRMEVALPVPLADPVPSEIDGWVWSGIADTSGVDWVCDDIADTSFRLLATVGTQTDCEAWGPEVDRFPTNCGPW